MPNLKSGYLHDKDLGLKANPEPFTSYSKYCLGSFINLITYK